MTNLTRLLFLSAALLLMQACQEPSTLDRKGIPGRIFHAQINDSLLLVYSVLTKERVELGTGTSRNNLNTIAYEEAYLSGVELNGTNVKLRYKVLTPCAQASCGTHYIDKVLAVGQDYLAIDCHCQNNFSIVSAKDGKAVFFSNDLSKRYPELKEGIAKYRAGENLHQIDIDANDGKKYSLSLQDLSLKPFSSTDVFTCAGGNIPETMGWTEMGDKRYYFDGNNEDNQSFLVVRAKSSGTSQSRLYRHGEAFLCAGFLTHPQECKVYQHNGYLFVLHAKHWNDALEKDLLTTIDANGDRKFTVSLQDLGMGKEHRKYFAKGDLLYTLAGTQMTTLDLNSGKILGKVDFSTLE